MKWNHTVLWCSDATRTLVIYLGYNYDIVEAFSFASEHPFLQSGYYTNVWNYTVNEGVLCTRPIVMSLWYLLHLGNIFLLAANFIPGNPWQILSTKHLERLNLGLDRTSELTKWQHRQQDSSWIIKLSRWSTPDRRTSAITAMGFSRKCSSFYTFAYCKVLINVICRLCIFMDILVIFY